MSFAVRDWVESNHAPLSRPIEPDPLPHVLGGLLAEIQADVLTRYPELAEKIALAAHRRLDVWSRSA